METIILSNRKLQNILSDRNWKKIHDEILKSIEKCISNNPTAKISNRGLNIYFREITVKFEAGWGTEVSLSISGDEVMLQEENTDKKHKCVQVNVSMNWSSTSRNLESAGIALRLYDEAYKVGQMIKGMYSDFYLLHSEESDTN